MTMVLRHTRLMTRKNGSGGHQDGSPGQKCLLHKPDDLGWFSETHIKMEGDSNLAKLSYDGHTCGSQGSVSRNSVLWYPGLPSHRTPACYCWALAAFCAAVWSSLLKMLCEEENITKYLQLIPLNLGDRPKCASHWFPGIGSLIQHIIRHQLSCYRALQL